LAIFILLLSDANPFLCRPETGGRGVGLQIRLQLTAFSGAEGWSDYTNQSANIPVSRVEQFIDFAHVQLHAPLHAGGS
jgi:hypothetical protein